MLIFYLTCPFLLLLALSYLLTSRERILSLEFGFWLISYQFIFIGLLGIGLIQSHIGCQMPLDECYVEGYPPGLDFFKGLVEITTLFWIVSAVAVTVFNIRRTRISTKLKRVAE
jgi:hypothetical protein